MTLDTGRTEQRTLAAGDGAGADSETAVLLKGALAPAVPEAPAAPVAPVPETVGARLARARAASRLDLDEVSRRTYIRPTVLRRMEDNDFAACGGSCYARGQLRILAAALNVDGDELVSAFDREAAVADSLLDDAPTGLTSPRPRRTARAAGLGLLVLLLLAVVLVLVVGPRLGV